MIPRATASIRSHGDAGPDGRRSPPPGRRWSTSYRRRNVVVGAERRVAAGHPDHARDVARVAADGAADVEHDRLAGADHPLARLVVRRRAVGPRRDDPELGDLVALGEQPLPDLARDVGLGATDQRPAGDRGDHPVGGVGGPPQQLDLVRVLAHPQRAQHRRREREARARQHPLQPEDEGGAQPVRHGDRRDVGGRRDPARPRAVVATRRIGSSVSSQVATVDVAGGGRGAGPGRRGLEPRGDQRDRRAVGGRDHEQREPLERHGHVAGEIAQVGAHPDQQGVEPGRAAAAPRAVEPLARTVRRGRRRVIRPAPAAAVAAVEIQAASTRSPCSNRARYA